MPETSEHDVHQWGPWEIGGYRQAPWVRSCECGAKQSRHSEKEPSEALMVRIVLDRDCPGCDWPEVVAVGESFEAGPQRVECGRREPCGYSVPASEWRPARA